MPLKPRPTYTAEFKAQAVELLALGKRGNPVSVSGWRLVFMIGGAGIRPGGGLGNCLKWDG